MLERSSSRSFSQRLLPLRELHTYMHTYVLRLKNNVPFFSPLARSADEWNRRVLALRCHLSSPIVLLLAKRGAHFKHRNSFHASIIRTTNGFLDRW